jgi:hypothetical protein
MWYLTTGAVLAVTRVVLLVWLNHRLASHVVTQTDYLIVSWLYPEFILPVSGGLYGTAYYLAWGTLLEGFRPRNDKRRRRLRGRPSSQERAVAIDLGRTLASSR